MSLSAPSAVASFLSVTAFTYSRTMTLPRTVEPARITPMPSTRQRLACRIASGGMSWSVVAEMKRLTAVVAPLIGAERRLAPLAAVRLPVAAAAASVAPNVEATADPAAPWATTPRNSLRLNRIVKPRVTLEVGSYRWYGEVARYGHGERPSRRYFWTPFGLAPRPAVTHETHSPRVRSRRRRRDRRLQQPLGRHIRNRSAAREGDRQDQGDRQSRPPGSPDRAG